MWHVNCHNLIGELEFIKKTFNNIHQQNGDTSLVTCIDLKNLVKELGYLVLSIWKT